MDKYTHLFSNLLLLIPREGCKRVKFRPNQEWNCSLKGRREFHARETSFKRHKMPARLPTRPVSNSVRYRVTEGREAEHRPTHLVKPPCLSIPLFHRVQRRLSRKVEHEQYGNGVIANEREHVYKLSLPSKVPDGECDCRPSDGNGLLHEINACREQVER